MRFFYIIIRHFVVIVVACTLISCEDQIVNQCDEKEIESGESLSNLGAIQKNVFNVSCALSGCHSGSNPQANLNLEDGKSYTNLVNINSLLHPGEKRVIPNNSAASILIKSLRGEISTEMPLGASPLSNAVIDSIALWIDNGALNN